MADVAPAEAAPADDGHFLDVKEHFEGEETAVAKTTPKKGGFGKRRPNSGKEIVYKESVVPYGSREFCEQQRRDAAERRRIVREEAARDAPPPMPPHDSPEYFAVMHASELAMSQELSRREFWADFQKKERGERYVPWRELQMQDKAGEFSAPPGHPANVIRGICQEKHSHMHRADEAWKRADGAKEKTGQLLNALANLATAAWRDCVDNDLSRENMARSIAVATSSIRHTSPLIEDLFLRVYYTEGFAQRPPPVPPRREDDPYYLSSQNVVNAIVDRTREDVTYLKREHRARSPEMKDRKMQRGLMRARTLQLNQLPTWRSCLQEVVIRALDVVDPEALADVPGLPGTELVGSALAAILTNKKRLLVSDAARRVFAAPNLLEQLACVAPEKVPRDVAERARAWVQDPRCSVDLLERSAPAVAPLAEWARRCLVAQRVHQRCGPDAEAKERTQDESASLLFVLDALRADVSARMAPAREDVAAAVRDLARLQARDPQACPALAVAEASEDHQKAALAVGTLFGVDDGLEGKGAWGALAASPIGAVLEEPADQLRTLLRVYEAREARVPLLDLAPLLRDAELGERLERDSPAAALLYAAVKALYVYGEARERHSALRAVQDELAAGWQERTAGQVALLSADISPFSPRAQRSASPGRVVAEPRPASANFTPGTVTDADFTNIDGYSTFEAAAAAAAASSTCKGIWQRAETLQYVLLDKVGGKRTWVGTDTAGVGRGQPNDTVKAVWANTPGKGGLLVR